jgi:hypothetical protein
MRVGEGIRTEEDGEKGWEVRGLQVSKTLVCGDIVQLLW